jgi:leader peptidase (prepilin peptidase)/N-methyltransferase
VADAAVLGSWGALVRAVVAAAAAFLVAAALRTVAPPALGFGDVKLLALLGLLTGALTSLVLLATGRAGWRTAIPFGPPLLVGAVLALALAGPGSLG